MSVLMQIIDLTNFVKSLSFITVPWFVQGIFNFHTIYFLWSVRQYSFYCQTMMLYKIATLPAIPRYTSCSNNNAQVRCFTSQYIPTTTLESLSMKKFFQRRRGFIVLSNTLSHFAFDLTFVKKFKEDSANYLSIWLMSVILTGTQVLSTYTSVSYTDKFFNFN